MNFLFKRAAEFNDENREALGENFFPVATFNEKSFAYEFEYEFFVESYVFFAEKYFGINDSSRENMYKYLYSSIDGKITKARHLFFINVCISAYAGNIRTASRFSFGHLAGIDSDTWPINIRTI